MSNHKSAKLDDSKWTACAGVCSMPSLPAFGSFAECIVGVVTCSAQRGDAFMVDYFRENRRCEGVSETLCAILVVQGRSGKNKKCVSTTCCIK